MAIVTEFSTITVDELPAISNERKENGSDFVQILATATTDGIDVTYTWLKDNVISNYRIPGVKKGTKVPSITDNFLAAFVFENETHDLFGVEIENIAIDFGGRFYDVSVAEPMTIISPELLAEKEKAAKAAAAKAAKEKAAAEKKQAEAQAAAPAADVELPAEKLAEIEAKVANLDPDKAEKLRVALIAKAKKEAAAAVPAAPAEPAADPEIPAEKMAEIEAKCANLDADKAEKLRTALIARAKKDIIAATKEGE